MEDYERHANNEKLVDLINESEYMCSRGDVAGWLDKVPEIASICLKLYEDTHDDKYREILLTVIESIDALMYDAMRKAPIEEKEKHNILRLKLYNVLRHFNKHD